MIGGNLGAAVQMLKVMNQQGGGQSWDTQLPNKTDLSVLIKDGSRSGLKLTDSINPGTGDIDILPAYLYKPAGTEYYYHADNGALDIGASDFTIAGWIKLESKVDAVNILGKIVAGSKNGRYGFYSMNTTGYLHFILQSSGGIIDIASTVDGSSDWHFVFADINQTTKIIRFFIDNTQIGVNTSFTGTFATLADVYEFYLGTGNSSDGSTVASTAKSSHSDTFVIHRLLSDVERTAAYNGSYPIDCAALWPLMGGGTHSFDVSGNNRTLTGVNISQITNTRFGSAGSKWGLNVGYTKYSNGYEDLYQGLKYDGTELTPTLTGGLAGFKKSVEGIHLGNLTDHNLANSVLAMKEASWDRSDATIFTDEARATTTFYNSTDADTKKYWHVSELNNLYMQALCNTGYKGLNFVKISDQSYKSRKILNGIFAYNSEITGADYLKAVETLCGDYVFVDTYEDDYCYWKWTTDNICAVNGAKMLKWENAATDKFHLSLDNGTTYTLSINSPFNGHEPEFCHIFNNGNILIASLAKLYISTNNLTSFAEVVPTGIDGNPFVATTNCYMPWDKDNSFVIDDVEMLIWGSYSTNVLTEHININVFYSVDSGVTIKSCYKASITNPPNLGARHIHSVKYNFYDNSFWMSTGDNEGAYTGEVNWIKGEYDWDNDTWSWSKIAGDLDNKVSWKTVGFIFDGTNVYAGDDNTMYTNLYAGIWRLPIANVADSAYKTRIFSSPYVSSTSIFEKLPYIIATGTSHGQQNKPVVITSINGIAEITGHRLYAYPTNYLGNFSCMNKNDADWYVLLTYISGVNAEDSLNNPRLLLKLKE